MKKINSIHYAGKIIGVGLFMMIVAPICLGITNLVFSSDIFQVLIRCCTGLGALILVGFFIYLGIELKQDKKVDYYYSVHHNVKIKHDLGENIVYECANCGNRKVKSRDSSCLVCGVRFSDEMDKTVEEVLKS